MLRILPVFFVLLLITLITGCGSSPSGPCKGVDCSGHGTCDDASGRAVCVCDLGFHQNGLLECIADADPCNGVTCDGWKQCINGACELKSGACDTKEDCAPTETCEEHLCIYHDPCEGIDCSGHGTCQSGYGYGSEVRCDCEEGYHAESLDCLPGASSDSDLPQGEEEPDIDTFDPCQNVQCKEWENCVEGSCDLKAGRCTKKEDCDTGKTCDLPNHTCINDPCTGISCGNGGVCSNSGTSPLCNCPDGYMAEGLSCVTDTATVISWCNVQWPPAIEATVGDAPVTVYSQLFVSGITDGLKPQNSALKSELGYTTVTPGYPVIQTDFTWIQASFNITGAGDFKNNHEYMASFPTTKAGKFNYLYRYTFNNGKSWAYCDTKGKVASAAITPGIATISGGGDDCGGISCSAWEYCNVDSCEPKPGRCTIPFDCPNTEICDTASHFCIDKNGALILEDTPQLSTDSCSFTVRYAGPGQLKLSDSTVLLNAADITDSITYESSTKTIAIDKTGLAKGKYGWLFRAKNEAGYRLKTLYVPVWIETAPFTWHDAFLYQVMTDRFKNGDNSNDNPVDGVDFDKNWQGGDFRGIIQKLEDGYFSEMGVNALWISSPIRNTQGKGKGMNDSKDYTAYHSYWPTATGWSDTQTLTGISNPIEPHFGTDAELDELVNKAHAQGIRVLIDFVANHVHTDSPLWNEHKTGGWFNMAPSGKTPNENGGYTCGWDVPEDCWFTSYLPDLNYNNTEVMKLVMDHAVWLSQEYNLDGFRLDAVKHMPMSFSTTIRTMIEREVATTGLPFYMVGETFDDNKGKLAAYVGSDKLDGQFDFPLYFQIRDVILKQTSSMNSLEAFVKDNDTYYQKKWAGAIMGNFMGNHDVVRALTFAGSDFKRVRMAQTFLFTSPAVPLIYQGDDIGMPGNEDPDNRKMMLFGGTLSAEQTATISHLRKLGTLRLAHPALRTGTRTTLMVNDTFWAYRMKDANEELIVILNRGAETTKSLNTSLTGTLTDAISGNTATAANGSVTVTLPTMGTAVYYKK